MGMTANATHRTATVNRDSDGTVEGVAVFLSGSDLERLGIDATNFQEITVSVGEGRLDLVPTKLRPQDQLDENADLLSWPDAPRGLTRDQIERQYPNEEPTDYGEYWERQRIRALAFNDWECQYCGSDDVSELTVKHGNNPEKYGPDKLKDAHDMLGLFVCCPDCGEGLYEPPEDKQ